MGYLTKKEYLHFFSLTGRPRVRWYHRLPLIGWPLFQRALRKYSMEELRKSIRQRLLTDPGDDFPFKPDYGMPFQSLIKVNAPTPEDVSEADRKNRVLPDLSFTVDLDGNLGDDV